MNPQQWFGVTLGLVVASFVATDCGLLPDLVPALIYAPVGVSLLLGVGTILEKRSTEGITKGVTEGS